MKSLGVVVYSDGSMAEILMHETYGIDALGWACCHEFKPIRRRQLSLAPYEQ